MAVKPIPDGYHSLTPGFATQDALKAVDFFKKAFGAEERILMKGPDGKVAHCEMQIGDSRFMFGEAGAHVPAHTMRVMLYVTDADAVFKRALAAGAKEGEPMKDQFYGDRAGRVANPFGNVWFIATHKEDVSPAEMDKRMKAMMAGGNPP